MLESMSFDKPSTTAVNIASLSSGKIDIYVRWNIVESTHIMLNKQSTPCYKYNEVKIRWTLPKYYETIDDLSTYITSIESELLDWAKATTIGKLS